MRSPKPVRSILTGIVLLFAPFSVMEIAAPSAHADAVDANFLNALKAKGITFASGQAAVIAGH